MGDMMFEKTEIEILKEQLSAVRCENERIKKQNVSLQKDLNNVIEAHNRAIGVIDKLVERGSNAKVNAKGKTSSEVTFDWEKL